MENPSNWLECTNLKISLRVPMCGPFSYKQEETWFLLYSHNNKNLFNFDIKNDKFKENITNMEGVAKLVV